MHLYEGSDSEDEDGDACGIEEIREEKVAKMNGMLIHGFSETHLITSSIHLTLAHRETYIRSNAQERSGR